MLANYPVAAMLRASDVARAKAFYTDTLGLSLASEMGDNAFGVSAGNGTQIYVYGREGSGPPANNVAAWMVDDLEAVARDLINRGVHPERYEMFEHDDLGIVDMGSARSLFFKDSEDNIIMVGQM